MEAIVNLVYSTMEVLGRMKQEKPLSIQDLKTEINTLKTKIVQLRCQIEIIELGN